MLSQRSALQLLEQQAQVQAQDGKNTAITTTSMVAFLSHTTTDTITVTAMATAANQNTAKFGYGALAEAAT